MLRGFVLRPKRLSMRAVGVAGLALERAEEGTGQTQQPSSIILSLSKERCAGAAGASKDAGCGLGARVRGWMLRGPCGAPQHEGSGCGSLNLIERAAYATHPPLACRPSPPQVGRSNRG
ncbi:hypothetical protein ASF29_05160 [Rhizobium sp. Leaf262]|nr:hypothetical protein ASF29_05160 [Rhizobium sp. Leaf262]